MARLKGKPGTIVRVVKSGNRFNAFDATGNKFTSYIGTGSRKKAHAAGNALECRLGNTGKVYWWQVSMDKFDATKNIPVADSNVEVPEGHDEIVDFINNSYSLKPVGLIMSELK